MKQLSPEDALVYMLMIAFGTWSILSVLHLPFAPQAMSPHAVSGEHSIIQPPTSLPPKSAGGARSTENLEWNIESLQNILAEAIPIGYFSKDPRLFILDLKHPPDHITLALFSESTDYRSIARQAEQLNAACNSLEFKCVVILSYPDDFPALRDGYLAKSYIPTFLADSALMKKYFSGPDNSAASPNLRDSIHAMAFGRDGKLLSAVTPLVLAPSDELRSIARDSLLISQRQDTLVNTNVDSPPTTSPHQESITTPAQEVLPPTNAEPFKEEGPQGSSTTNQYAPQNSQQREASHSPEQKQERAILPQNDSKSTGDHQAKDSKQQDRKITPGKSEQQKDDRVQGKGKAKDASYTQTTQNGQKLSLSALPFTIYSVKDGVATRLASWVAKQGKPVVLNFWATWCIPCRKELPLLSRLSKEHKELLFVGLVDGDPAPRTYREVSDLLHQTGADFPQYVFPQSQLQVEITGGRSLPAFAAFDRQGRLVKTLSGSISDKLGLESMMALLKTLRVEQQDLSTGPKKNEPANPKTPSATPANCKAESYLNSIGGGDLINYLRSFYSTRLSPEEFCPLMESLRGIVEHGLVPGSASAKNKLNEILKIAPETHLTLFLDPLCEKCAEVLGEAKAFGDRYGELTYILAPSEAADSVQSTTALLRVRSLDPIHYSEAVRTVSFTVSRDPSLLCPILETYLPPKACVTDIKGDPSLQKDLQESLDISKAVASLGASPPVIVYKRRLIARTGGEIPFDPFRDKDHLKIVLELIKLSAERR